MDVRMDPPQQTGYLHSSCERRAAQRCHCETPPAQSTERCCHPTDTNEGQCELTHLQIQMFKVYSLEEKTITNLSNLYSYK